MWLKLLHASATEALTERQNGKAFPAAGVSAVRSAITEAERGRESSKQVGKLVLAKKDSDKILLFETRDRDAAGGWLHKSYVVK
jgi:hypothetical protein